MRAAILDQYGPAHLLEVRDVPRPEALENTVVVRVRASPITQGDRRLRASDFPGITWLMARLMLGLRRPRNPVVGTILAGQVVEVGDGVEAYAPGDDVFGLADHGAHAEFVRVPADGALAKIPDGFSYADAAALPFGAQTAMHYLRDLARVQAGQHVAVVGAAGEVGRCAVQIAKHMGAEVTAICRTRSLPLVRALGADHVVDFTRQDFTTLGQVFDVVFDTADVLSHRSWVRCVSKKGIYLTLGLRLGLVYSALRSVVFGGPRVGFGVALPTAAAMAQLVAWMEQGVLVPTVRARFHLEDIADAHRTLEDRNGDGTVLVAMP